MKKILIFVLLAFSGASVLAANEPADAVAEIKDRYNISYGKAKSFCSDLPDLIGKVKILAGVSVGTSAAGTIAGGMASIAGFMKASHDKIVLKKPTEEEMRAAVAKMESAAARPVALTKPAEQTARPDNESKYDKQSIMLGNVRTTGNFVAGGAQAASAGTSLGGLKILDDLIIDMNACDSYVREIDKQAKELRIAAPDNPDIAGMESIVKNCDGLNSKNIADIKSKLKTAGIISIIGSAAGVAGGITSAVAVGKEKNGASAVGAEGKESTKGLNTASNVLAVATTATALTGAIIGGVSLAGLIKNGDVADKCKSAF